MKTSNNNIENVTVNYRIEIVRDFNNVYYVNMTADNGEYVKGLPEYVGYKELKKAVKCFTGCELPTLKNLTFEGKGRKRYAHIERTGHQTPKVLQPTPAITETEALAFNDALEIKVGDRVISKHYQQTATVTAIRKEKGETVYDVEFDKPVNSFWTGEPMTTTYFSRYGITKNYDPSTGCEIEGTAIYYAEELQADWKLREPRTVFDVEIYKPTEKRPSWLVVADIFSSPKETTLYEICNYLAKHYQEEHKAA